MAHSFKNGDLVEWVLDYAGYEANGDVLVGIDPNIARGVVMRVSKKDERYMAVFRFADGNWHVVDTLYDEVKNLTGEDNG